jgi:RNA polymerase sigma-70 factor (ECF subfamily)
MDEGFKKSHPAGASGRTEWGGMEHSDPAAGPGAADAHGGGSDDRSEDIRMMMQAAAGRSDAQRQVVERLLARARRVCRRLLGDEADSEDAAQQSLVEVLRASGQYRGDSSLERWADRIVARTAMRQAKERTRQRGVRASDVEPDAFAARGGDRWATEQAPRSAAAYLQRLPEDMRAALVLRYVLDYSVDEIAEATEVSRNTVKDRLLRGRRAMRQYIRRDQAIGTGQDGTKR